MSPEEECPYCYSLVTPVETPATTDDRMWFLMGAEHDPDCEWILTRAHSWDPSDPRIVYPVSYRPAMWMERSEFNHDYGR